MNKILSFEELQKLNEKLKPLLNLRNHIVNDDNSKENTTFKKEILVCGGTGCKASQSDKILSNLNKELKKAGLSEDIKVSITGCFGFCEKGPIIKIAPDNVF